MKEKVEKIDLPINKIFLDITNILSEKEKIYEEQTHRLEELRIK